MSRWSDLAVWRGPTENQTSGHKECRGLVVHIASGFYDGTISWERNPAANVSSHFVLGRDGQLAQLVDTDDTAWTQRDGNGRWLSVECEGFAAGDKDGSGRPWLQRYPGWDKLTDAQVLAVAKLLVRGHEQYGYPLQLAGDPTGKGLGYHSMGAEHGFNWGHLYCPGEPIKAQLPTILARALPLAGLSSTQGDEMLDLDQPIPGTVYGPTDKPRSLGLLLLDLHQALNPYQTTPWQNEALRNTRALLAGQAADEKRDAVLLATIQALTAGGTSVDTAAVLARINEVAAAESTTVAELAAQVADLTHKLAAGAAAEASALAQ